MGCEEKQAVGARALNSCTFAVWINQSAAAKCASEPLLKGVGRVKCLEYDISLHRRAEILWENEAKSTGWCWCIIPQGGGRGPNANFKLDIAKLFMWRKQLCAASARDINSNLPAVCFRLFNKALSQAAANCRSPAQQHAVMRSAFNSAACNQQGICEHQHAVNYCFFSTLSACTYRLDIFNTPRTFPAVHKLTW